MNSEEVTIRARRPTFDLEKELQTAIESQDAGSAANSYESDDLERRISLGGQSSSPSSYPAQLSDPLFLNPDEDVTLGQYILDRAGDAFKGLFRNSQTILRVDLRQALRYDVPLRRQQQTTPVQPRRARAIRQPGRRSDTEVDEVDAQSWSHGLQGGGARLKLMQIWEFKDTGTGQNILPFNLNFGFGANVVMDRGEAEPKLRIRAPNLAFHFFPDPYLELRGKWPLFDTNLAICARYRLPVSSMRTFWESREQLRIFLSHRSGRLFHLTPGGLEFEDAKIPVGQFGTMRLAASVDFPRELPLQDGEQPFRLQIMRLGVKSRLM